MLSRVLAQMGDLRFAGIGMKPSLLDVYRSLVFAMSITFNAFGVLNCFPKVPAL